MHAFRIYKAGSKLKRIRTKNAGSKLISTQKVNNVFSKHSVQSSDAAVQRCSVKQLILRFSKNSKENTSGGIPFC